MINRIYNIFMRRLLKRYDLQGQSSDRTGKSGLKLSADDLRAVFTPFDLQRLEAYSRNMVIH